MSTRDSVSRADDQFTQHSFVIQSTITIRLGASVRLLVHRDLILKPWRGGELMAEFKLPRLTNLTPIKITISVLPDVDQHLSDYAAPNARAYGATEPLAELIPATLTAFLDGDREFAKPQRAVATAQH